MPDLERAEAKVDRKVIKIILSGNGESILKPNSGRLCRFTAAASAWGLKTKRLPVFGHGSGTATSFGENLEYIYEPVLPGCFLRAKAIGLVPMIDQGAKDDKIIAVCADGPEDRHYNDMKELPPHRLAEIRRFFEDCILPKIRILMLHSGELEAVAVDERCTSRILFCCLTELADQLKIFA
ncbi:Soluble inorganic pyrophosphatase 4 [Spatholobus suberectus]|nr:Soluble inorganic pyrophosphatase 4 [Spatholobus suberectus]